MHEIFRELRGLVDSLKDAVTPVTNPHRAMTAVRNEVATAVRDALRAIPGVSCEIFGEHSTRTARIAALCGDAGDTEIVQVRPDDGTHELIVTIRRVPIPGRTSAVEEDDVTLGSVTRLMERTQTAMERTQRAHQFLQQNSSAFPPEMFASVKDDVELYKDLLALLSYERTMQERDHDTPTAPSFGEEDVMHTNSFSETSPTE